jgi:AraC-like DNA-binding protein
MKRGHFKIFRCGTPGIEAMELDTCHVFPRHTHEQFGIGAIDRGAQKSLSGRGMVEAGPGDVITVNPGEVHDGAPIGNAGRAWRILYFDPSLLGGALNDLTEGKTGIGEFIHPVLRDARARNRLRRLFAVVASGNVESTALQRQELLLMLLPALVQARTDKASIPKAVFDAKSLIDDDPVASITLTDLALASGLSRFQVLRAFVRVTGLTPHAYHVQRRIDVARRLIARGTRLAEAALASGFADQSHMTRIFVRTYGVSPRAYANAAT